jgi:SAM-dependent methyltransferase
MSARHQKHFVLTDNRQRKALKIERILAEQLDRQVEGLRILDVGCGSGEIAEHFFPRNEVHCVDIEDQRLHPERSRFSAVQDERLPFEDAIFDVVISNHIIEHVPDRERHLDEVRRVLKSDGLAYLATPNRYFPFEVHYRLPLLHWLPNGCFHALVKLTGRYHEDIHLYGYFGLRRALRRRFLCTEYTHRILRRPADYFADDLVPFGLGRLFPAWLNWLSPTMVWTLRKRSD